MVALKCFVLLFAISTVAADGGYRSDYEYSGHAKGYFKLHNTPTTWNDAELKCFNEGSILASPLDDNLRDVLASIMKENKDVTGFGVHTGISNIHSNEVYQSVEGVPLAEISTQYSGPLPEAYFSGTHCLTMLTQGCLIVGNCDASLPYICYKKDKEPQLTECGTLDKDYHLDARTGHCYKFHKNPAIWGNAFKTCAIEGGYLAIINSQAEAEVLKELFAKFPYDTIVGGDYNNVASIGYLYWYKSGIWRTIHGESLEDAGFSIWEANKPDNLTYKGQRPTCGSVNRQGLLDDNYCHLPYAFICEKEPIIKFY